MVNLIQDDFSVNDGGDVDLAGELTGSDQALSTDPAIDAAAATVFTDKPDYSPGETVVITATGFAAGSEIQFAIADDPSLPGDDGDADVYSPFAVTDGGEGDLDGLANGQVVTQWLVPTDDDGSGSGTPDALNATLQLTATGSDGQVAVVTFTDAAASTNKVYQHWADQVNQPQGVQWQGDILSEGKSDYFEGEVIPHVFFYKASNQTPLTKGNTYSFNVTYNYYQQNTDAGGFAYMTTYDISRQPSDFLGASPSIAPSKDLDGFDNYGGFKVAEDPSGFSGFYTVDADIKSVSNVSYTGSLGQTRDGVVAITFVYTGEDTTNGLAAIYYGLYVAKPGDVPDQGLGKTNGAGAWSGGSLQTTVDIGGSGATSIQLNPSAIIQGEISGLKFNDLNANGLKDNGEPGIAGWTVYLDNDSDLGNGYLQSVVTSNGTSDDQDGNQAIDPLGFYYFSVTPDSTKDTPAINDPYYVFEGDVAGWTQSAPSSGSFGPLIISAATPQYLNQNFGNFKDLSISGYKFIDTVGDGVWGEGDPGYNYTDDIYGYDVGWTIYLGIDNDKNGQFDDGDQQLATATTDISGKYQFDNLGPLASTQQYIVWESDIPVTPDPGDPVVPGADTADDWTRTYSDNTAYYTLDPSKGETIEGRSGIAEKGNFGNFKNLDLGCYKWLDVNGNGIWDWTDENGNEIYDDGDVGETGGNGWTIYLSTNPAPANPQPTDPGVIRTYVTTDEPDTQPGASRAGFYEFQNITPKEIGDALTLYVYEEVRDGYNKTFGGYEFDISSGETVVSDYGATQRGNIGNFAYEATIAIDKTTQDVSPTAGTAGDDISVLAGDEIKWIYTVTNTGNVALSNISVSDSKGVTPAYQSGDANLDGKLDTTETWIYEASGTAVKGSYSNTGTASGDYTDTAGHQDTTSASDDSSYFAYEATIAIDKTTQDVSPTAGTAGDDISVLAGDEIKWIYTVTNTGNVALSNISVSDSKGVTPAYQSGDANLDGKLDTTETWIYEASGTAVKGSYSNTGTASGDYTDTAGHQDTTSASDDSSYFAYEATIAIDKTTQDVSPTAGTAGDDISVLAGDEIKWIYTVTNTGNVALSNISVSDSKGVTPAYQSGDANLDGKLDTTETWIYEASGTAVKGSYSNTGTASGDYTDTAGHQDTTSASDDSSYFAYEATIAIDKTTQDVSPTAGTAGDDISVLAGDEIKWIYTVTNTGNVALSNISVSDSKGVTPAYQSGDANLDGKLDTTETWIYEASGTAVKGSYSNTGTASGDYTDTAGHQDTTSASDDSSYFAYEATIAIDKTTQDVSPTAGTAGDDISVLAGDEIKWIYTVTNTGNVALSNISVSDSKGVTPAYQSGDANLDGKLDTTETWIYEASGTAVKGSYSNTGTASGDYTDTAGHQDTTSASDDSSYFAYEATIAIDKTTQDVSPTAGTAGDDISVLAGDEIKWIYTVTNTGNVALSNISVSDSKGVTPAYQSGDANLDGKLDTTETWIYEASGTAVKGSYSNTGTASGDYTDTAGHQDTTSASDDSSYFAYEATIAIDKTTQDVSPTAGTAGDDISVLAGDEIKWIYTVTNTGNVALSNISVSDSKGVTPAYQSGDANLDGKLDTTETWIYEASGTAVKGSYSNTGTASGDYTDTAGHQDTTSASDDSSYFAYEATIAIDKTTQDVSPTAGTAGDDISVLAGDEIKWIYTVTNTGNVALSNISVSDSKGVTPAYQSGDANLDGKLDTTETWIYEASGTAVKGSYSNTGTASGDYTDTAGHQDTTSASDDSSYFAYEATIAIDKTTQDVSPTAGTAGDDISVLAGDEIKWIYTVTNTGNVALSNISVSDSKGVTPAYQSGDANLDGKLDTTETWIYEASGTAVKGSYSNTGTASGDYTDTAGHQDTTSASDDSSYFGADPQITIEKYVSVNNGISWDEADSPTGPTLVNTLGIDPQFKFVVTNTGNVGLSSVTLDDPKLDLNGGQSGTAVDIGDLAVGEIYESTFTGTWQAGQWTNTAYTSGSYADAAGHSKSVNAQDDANYFGALPGLVTNSSLCTFDSNSTLAGKQFNLLFTPDFNLASGNYKLSDSNPGQFYYNVFYNGSPGEIKGFELNIPEPFIPQGAVPVHAYSDVHIDQSGGAICLTPGTEIANFKLADLGTGDLDGDGIQGHTFTVTLPSSGFVYVNMHLDYGLEKQTGWAKQTPVTGTDHAIDNPNVSGIQPTIKDDTPYVFSSNITGSADTVRNDNIFKNIKGVGGKTKLADTGDPLVNQSIVLKDGNGKTVGAARSDSDGWWFTSVNAPGKSSTYSAYWDKNNDGNVKNDPVQTIQWGGPVKYVNVDFTQAGLHLDSSDAACSLDAAAPKLTRFQLAPVIDAARDYWSAQGADVSQLRHVDVLIGDLDGSQLGTVDNDSLITLDADAAGHGWSVSMGRITPGKVDLYSAVTHEFGHILGYDHDVMGATLGIGERHLPFEAGHALKDQLFPMAAAFPPMF